MRFGFREIIFVNLMLALLAASWWFGFKKVNERKEQLRAEMTIKQKELSDLDEATADVADLQKQIEDLQRAIDFFEGKLPREKEVNDLLREVSKAAEGANLEIRQFEPMMTVRGSHYSELPVRIVLAGGFEGFYLYMLELEKLARITRVTDMKLKKMQERNGAMEAEMTLSIFFEPTLIGNPVASSN
jgi:type IV pilus assembly protein PilO